MKNIAQGACQETNTEPSAVIVERQLLSTYCIAEICYKSFNFVNFAILNAS